MTEQWQWLNYPDGRKLLATHDRAIIHCPGPGPEMAVSEDDQAKIAAAPRLEAENTRLRERNAELLATCEGFLHHIRVLQFGKECGCDLCVKVREIIARAKGGNGG